MPPKKKPGAKTRGRAGRNLEQTVRTDAYEHPEASAIQRPEAGQQTQFRKKQPPRTYRYDSSLSPALDWDGQNPVREQGEAALARMKATLQDLTVRIRALGSSQSAEKDALQQAAAFLREDVEKLVTVGKPFLNWAGKAERTSFEVPTLPLFVHDKLSTEAIIASLKAHRRDEQAGVISLDLFGDERQSIADKLIRAYEHQGKWVNRMILGDSLVVMSSLLHYEKLGGQVQMIFMDPPYGVKFGSNFQPFVRRREVRHNDDAEFTREPEMVQAYRDTWELGLHSYLTYLRDRLLLARDLLSPSGSVFVQISDVNLHYVRAILDEIFGPDNFVSVISFVTTSGFPSTTLSRAGDYLLWYARDIGLVKYRQLFAPKNLNDELAGEYKFVRLRDGTVRGLTDEERTGAAGLPSGARVFRYGPLTSSGATVEGSRPFVFDGQEYRPSPNNHWKVSHEGLERLAARGMLIARKKSLSYFLYLDLFPVAPVANVWTDTKWGFDAGEKAYVVQTNVKVIQRCVLMTTDPGDLVFDPTCGSGTTAHVAEQWGRRWITVDTSRVPLALARQRLLTANFPWYELADPNRGPGGGFVYKRRQNKRGEEVGGVVPHTTLGSMANDAPPKEEILVDRPEVTPGIVRVSGPFWLEATIPTPVDFDEDGLDDSMQTIASGHVAFTGRMLEILRRSPLIRISGAHTVRLYQIRPPAKSVYLSAEALVDTTAAGQAPTLVDAAEEAEAKRVDRLDVTKKSVAFVFGPEHSAVSEKLVFSAGKEANAKHYTHLYVIGFAIQPDARSLVEQAESLLGIPATYVQATPDLMMGDLLKTTQASQVFSVCGLPDVEARKRQDGRWEVELRGLDTFDPTTNEVKKLSGKDVPAWFLDVAWNEQVFHVSQAFFPRTGAWDDLKKALKGDYAESLWEHLAGTVSAPFDGQRGERIAVKVIDDRGNELQVVRTLGEP
jgi:adenine-specific DNA-methyltransferase